MSEYQQIEKEVTRLGFLVRGGFAPEGEDTVPNLSSGQPTQTVIMIGNAGSTPFWNRFTQSSEYKADSQNPMDNWTRRVMEDLAKNFGGEVLFPSDGPPYYPFQRWSSRAESLYPSPIGLYISHDWGTWHALRAAILLPESVDNLPELSQKQSPCLSCKDQPCLSSCPVDAFGIGQVYDYLACAKHVVSEEGADCASKGCLARRVCPVGQEFTLTPEHVAFHMAAFTRARRDSGEVF
ncbi:ferredoxin [Kiloniella sp.]|uniref:ferredoxin n=1 Tax=Kiloniella sp. TaxID=1938587 RepID=UPI003B016FF8